MSSTQSLGQCVGLFAGIGGLELGMVAAGFQTSLLVENFAAANHVLRIRFPDAKITEDVRDLDKLPNDTHIVTAGFPCQDLSSVGLKAGIEGARSGLIGEVMRLLRQRPAPWVVLENVPFLLRLNKGAALDVVASALEKMGYRWAYRIVDTAAFGIPQRRRRWFLVASLTGDPRSVLLEQDQAHRKSQKPADSFGFYWTEGNRGLGWADGVIPPLKCGSSVGIPSPPAIVMPDKSIVVPEIRDAERLQGFEPDWTQPAEDVGRSSLRWKLVGNAVSVPASKWIGTRIAANGADSYSRAETDPELRSGAPWPPAAWFDGERRAQADVSHFPVRRKLKPVHEFLKYDPKPLSIRAASGFLSRAERSDLRFADGFLDDVRRHIERQRAKEA